MEYGLFFKAGGWETIRKASEVHLSHPDSVGGEGLYCDFQPIKIRPPAG